MLDLLSHDEPVVGDWSVTRLRACVQAHRSDLESRGSSLAQVAIGHGDAKPGNILVDQHHWIRFIDLELAGLHYAAYDIAKLFRDNDTWLDDFLVVYAKERGVTVSREEVDRLRPMTWLEAAIFFVCMLQQDQGNEDLWRKLAVDRLANYEASVR